MNHYQQMSECTKNAKLVWSPDLNPIKHFWYDLKYQQRQMELSYITVPCLTIILETI